MPLASIIPVVGNAMMCDLVSAAEQMIQLPKALRGCGFETLADDMECGTIEQHKHFDVVAIESGALNFLLRENVRLDEDLNRHRKL
ncbi:hypothetical protein ACU4GI_20515 [Cupriavidus basilensis]